MDTLQYLLERQRLLQKANIYNSFYGPNDEIEKAPAYTTSRKTHEYIGIHISKNGNKVYDYLKDARHIKGNPSYLTEKEPHMEVTEDKEGKNIKIFTTEETEKVKELMQNKLGLTEDDIYHRHSTKTSTQYIKIDQGKRHYDIRLADHTYTIPKEDHKILLNNRYRYKSNGLTFIIEASIYNYSPEDIVNSIQGTEKAFKLFNSKKNLAKIRKYIEEYEDKGGEDDKDRFKDSVLYPHTIAMELAGLYMKENELTDDEYYSNFTALSSIMEREIDTYKK